MSEHKGKGVKGKPYDELSGVGTSQAGITGTTGNLNTAGRDGGVGMPSVGDAGNRQNADLGEHDNTPALGRSGRASQNRQAAPQQNRQSGDASASADTGEPGQEPKGRPVGTNPNVQGDKQKR